MKDEDIEELSRRSERAGAALNFLGGLASPQSLRAMLESLPVRQLQNACDEAVQTVELLAQGISGRRVNPRSARRHAKALRDCLGPEWTASVQRHASAVLEALGFKVASEPEEEGPNPRATSKGTKKKRDS